MNDLDQKLRSAEALLLSLGRAPSLEQRCSLLLETEEVCSFSSDSFTSWIQGYSTEDQYLILLPIALGQGPHIYGDLTGNISPMIRTLAQIERFYSDIGGVVGYQVQVLRLLASAPTEMNHRYLQPPRRDIRNQDRAVNDAIREGIASLGQMAELYPVGGAGDRLALMSEDDSRPLPAAQLPFCGCTLIEGLFRDLQAREYLHFKLFNRQLITPVALMTSHEKENDHRIRKILEEHHTFHRPKESVRLFTQPLVPLFDEEGNWIAKRPMHLRLKPGGHGVVWNLAIQEGIFDWFEEQGRSKGLVRQINNPIAGIDYGLPAFTGVGLGEDKAFGFASCPRVVNMAEGTDVLIETPIGTRLQYTLSNVEYTEFEKRGIEDVPTHPGGSHSMYPANTNILFFDIEAIREAVTACPIPGMTLNMKNRVEAMQLDGSVAMVKAGRLESTMQNISDAIVVESSSPLMDAELRAMPVYLTYNERRKTLSVAKNAFRADKVVAGTPEGCFYEWLENMVDLFRDHCGVDLPPLEELETYLDQGPTFNIHYHPALGPLFQVIAQKVRGGSMREGSELILHIAELELRDVAIDGSLLIQADHPMGHVDDQAMLTYTHGGGKCTLQNCKVKNRGIHEKGEHTFWKQEVVRHEALIIRLIGNGEFFAENVTFTGNHNLVVPDGHRMVAEERDGTIDWTLEPIAGPTWWWDYAFDENNNITLKKHLCSAPQTDTRRN